MNICHVYCVLQVEIKITNLNHIIYRQNDLEDERRRDLPCMQYKYLITVPREELLKVVGLKHSEIAPSSSRAFSTTVMWEKPLFKHSAVKYYRYKISAKENQLQIRRRATELSDVLTTVSLYLHWFFTHVEEFKK